MYISDSHNDFLTNLDENNIEKYIKKLNNIKLISSAIFTTNKRFNINDIKNYKKLLNKLKEKYNINIILSIEDLGFIENNIDLDELINVQPFSTTLTWNEANKFAGGANTNLGLTDLGRHTISKLEENNILVDTAHMSRESFYEFSSITTRQIYNSHSNIAALYSHNRNLTADQIAMIINSNGYIGLTIYEKFISNDKISSTDIAQQFDYLIRKFSSFHFGFGTDFYGIDTEYLPTDINDYEDLNKVANTLLDLNHSHDIVERIMYKNFLDFYSRTNKKDTH